MRCDKGCFFFIRTKHWDLVVTEESVYEGEHFIPKRGINNLIDSGQNEVIIQASVI